MALYSCRNPPRSAVYIDPDKLGDFEQGTPAPSAARLLDIPVPTPASAKYTEENFRTITSSAWIRSSKLQPVVPNLQANKKYEDHFDTAGATGINRIPSAALFFCGYD